MERNDEEDDAVTFVGSPSLDACKAESKSNGQVLFLNTNLARMSFSRETQDDDLTGLERQTTPVTIVFDLPDGSQVDQEFQLGQTVEALKSFIESDFGIPMSGQDMYLGSVLMMDPMSLLDYPEFDGIGEVLIVVEGDMSEKTKK
ncbi:unnamed protein product [Pylaiella littoralis]